jgi:hypothetical protein
MGIWQVWTKRKKPERSDAKPGKPEKQEKQENRKCAVDENTVPSTLASRRPKGLPGPGDPTRITRN